MEKIYRLTPSTHDNIWGGEKLRAYGKKSEKDRIAESWELSFVKGNEATIKNGATTIEAFPKECWGKNAQKFEFFPTLTKFIDARENLSVQVHPDDEYALKNENQYGKSEMWYVVEADPGAGIYMGLKHKCEPDEFKRRVKDGSVEELLKFHEVKGGDVFFIPAGTIHAIGSGVLIYEIQQNSTLTYRLYDYMRKDKSGNMRELHIDKAMIVANLDEYKKPDSSAHGKNVIGHCEYFETREYNLNGQFELNVSDESFLSITVISGEGYIEGEKATAGDSFFCPASSGKISIEAKARIITVSIP